MAGEYLQQNEQLNRVLSISISKEEITSGNIPAVKPTLAKLQDIAQDKGK